MYVAYLCGLLYYRVQFEFSLGIPRTVACWDGGAPGETEEPLQIQLLIGSLIHAGLYLKIPCSYLEH